MRLGIRRLFAATAIATVTMLGTVVGAASPAQAAPCPSGYFCLWHWIDYGGGRWQVNPSTFPTGHCWNLTNSTYTDGATVYDTSASYFDASNGNHTIVFYDWINCNTSGAQYSIEGGIFEWENNLNTVGWYHRFSSIKIT